MKTNRDTTTVKRPKPPSAEILTPEQLLGNINSDANKWANFTQGAVYGVIFSAVAISFLLYFEIGI